jgi:hypothetical protein
MCDCGIVRYDLRWCSMENVTLSGNGAPQALMEAIYFEDVIVPYFGSSVTY